MSADRAYSPLDRCLMQLESWFAPAQVEVQATIDTEQSAPPLMATPRPRPDAHLPEATLSAEARRLSARLMRVNHAGEVAAQGLYQGQAWVARTPEAKTQLRQSAEEEHDHLLWCAQRVQELGGRTSLFEPLWHLGSVSIGAAAGLMGDRTSLGFVVETERQVIAHLEAHLRHISPDDLKSRTIIQQMQADEAHHAALALKHGGAMHLPAPVPLLMRMAAKVMTGVSYWV